MPASDVRKAEHDAFPKLGTHWIAPILALGLLRSAAKPFELPLSWPLLALCLSGGIAVYALDHRRSALATISCLCTAISFFFLPRPPQAMALMYVFLGVWYQIPLRGKRLQDLERCRFAAIVLGWAALPLMLPGFPLRAGSFLLLGHLGFMGANVLWSDWKDREEDLARGRKTPSNQRSTAELRVASGSCSLLGAVAYFCSGELLMSLGPLLQVLLQEWSFQRKKQPELHWVDLLMLCPLLASFLS